MPCARLASNIDQTSARFAQHPSRSKFHRICEGLMRAPSRRIFGPPPPPGWPSFPKTRDANASRVIDHASATLQLQLRKTRRCPQRIRAPDLKLDRAALDTWRMRSRSILPAEGHSGAFRKASPVSGMLPGSPPGLRPGFILPVCSRGLPVWRVPQNHLIKDRINLNALKLLEKFSRLACHCDALVFLFYRSPVTPLPERRRNTLLSVSPSQLGDRPAITHCC